MEQVGCGGEWKVHSEAQEYYYRLWSEKGWTAFTGPIGL
jgi:hypothetical protein